MTKVVWAVDTLILESPTAIGDITEAIKKCDRAELFETKYIPLSNDQKYPVDVAFNQPVILYGTIGYVSKCRSLFYPRTYADGDTTNCNIWMTSNLQPFLLNRDYFMMPFGEVKRKLDFIFKTFGDGIFIRPNTGKKAFAGTTFNSYNGDHELYSIQELESVTDEILCVIAPAKKLKAEYRFLVGNGDVIDYSQYRRDDILDVRHDTTEEALNFAKSIAGLRSGQPDLIYTLDVAELINGDHAIIEINCFNCSGLYAMDRNIVVEQVTDIVLKDYYGKI